MSGRVLEDDELEAVIARVDHGDEDVMSLVATIRDREDRILELRNYLKYLSRELQRSINGIGLYVGEVEK